MNAFDIPAVSAFRGDTSFYGQRQVQHRGAPVQMERKPRRPRPSRAKPKAVIDIGPLIEFRQAGASYPQCKERFGFSMGFIRRALVGVRKPRKPKKPRQRASRSEPLGTRYYVLLTPEQRQHIADMGGAIWLRSIVSAHMKEKAE